MGRKIRIDVRECLVAFDKMGKNKAPAVDELLDIIFQVKEFKKLFRKLNREDKMEQDWQHKSYTQSEE